MLHKTLTFIASVVLATCFARGGNTMGADSVGEAYADSVFMEELRADQLTDSTLTDRLYDHFYRGMALYKTEKNKQSAINQFSRCLHLDTNVTHPDIYAASAYMISEIMMSVNDYNNAYFFLNVAHEKRPYNATYLEEIAWFEYSIQNFGKSADYFRKLNKLYPATPRYILGLSKAYRQEGKYNKALKEINRYIRLEGHSIQMLSERTDIWYTAQKPDKAIAEIEAYAREYPEEYLEAQYMLAQFYLLTGEKEKALSTLNDLNRRYPNDRTLLLAIADYYNKEGCDTLHRKYLFEAIRTHNIPAGNIPGLVRPVMSSFIQDSNRTAVTAIIDTLNVIYRDQLPILSLTADTYQALADTNNWLATLYKISPLAKSETTDLQIIDIEQKRGNYARIRQLTADGYDRYRNDHWAYYHVVSYGMEEMYDSLITTATTLLPAISGNNIRSLVYQIMGDTHSAMGNDSIALEMYDSCLHYNPNNSGALNNIAYGITKQTGGDLPRAEKLASKALELDPESTTILDTYAWILYLRGDYVLARIYFDKLSRIEEEKSIDTSVEVLYHRGMLCIKLDDTDCARQLFTQALELYKKEYTDKGKEISEQNIVPYINQWLTDNK